MTLSARTQGWESIWAELDALPEYWRTPERAVVAWAERLWEAGGRRVLDVGCGVGRHSDKHLPHHYCDEAGLRAFLAGLVVDDLCLVRVAYVGEGDVVQVGAHYHVQARRPWSSLRLASTCDWVYHTRSSWKSLTWRTKEENANGI